MDVESDIITKLPACPFCNTKGTAFYFVGEHRCRPEGTLMRYVSFWVCWVCEGGIVGESKKSTASTGSFGDRRVFDFANFTKVYPCPKELKAAPYTPKKIADTYVTALKLMRISPKDQLTESDIESCCMTIRKAIELAVNEQGAGDGNLYQKIESLYNRNILTSSMKEWAHELRAIGNNGAHEDGTCTLQDAEQAIYFAEMLFQYLYTLPSMISERRKLKEATS